MEGRRWEELEEDCLVKIFEKLGFEGEGFKTLLVDIPFVCKSWYKASLDPQCRKILHFNILDNALFVQKYPEQFGIKNFSSTKFMKLVAGRSTCATALVLPSHCTAEDLDSFSDQCPLVTYLCASLLYLDKEQVKLFAEAVGKYKFLQILAFDSQYRPLKTILAKISLNCESFSTLLLRGSFTVNDARAITTYTPRIKALILNGSTLCPGALQVIIKGCEELEFLDIRYCFGLKIDEEILKQVNHLKHFLCTGCRNPSSEIDHLIDISREVLGWFQPGEFDDLPDISSSNMADD